MRNFGVSADPKNGSLSLEEKGTVYNEMVTSMDQAPNRLFRPRVSLRTGRSIPCRIVRAALPEALRAIKPSDIRRFHAQHYFLANMGAIASLPKEMTLRLGTGAFECNLESIGAGAEEAPRHDRRPIAVSATGAGRPHRVCGIPFPNGQQPGTAMLLWPADRKLDLRDKVADRTVYE